MEMNVDVTEVRSREADTGLSAADSSVGSGNVNSEINDNTLTSESSPRQHTDNVRNDNEESSRSTNDELRPRASDSGNAARERLREDITATNSSRATPITDREVESSKGADGHPSAPQTPLAFTIDFGNNKEVDTAKYQNLFERYNARHRRNLSTSKVEVKSKKPSTILSPNLGQKQKVPSTHSEGYFSSEDDTKRKTDQLSERLKQLGVKNPSRAHSSTKTFGNENVDQQNKQYLMTRSSDGERSATINDLSRVQISNYDDDENEKQYTKNIEYIAQECEQANDFEDNKVSNMNYITDDFNIRNTNERESALSSVSYAMNLNADDIADTNLDVFNVSNVDAASDGAVSEAGTYTIHKDYTDEEKARMDIDKVFSVGVLTEDESNEAYVHNFKEQSDSNVDTDSYIRIKERIGLVSSQHQIIDSGGESDDDTSNSYNTPPNSSQRTPVHSAVGRRGSLSDSLFRRANSNENRRSIRKYLSSAKSKTADTNIELSNSPSQVLSTLHLERRSNSLDRKEYASDTTESNTSRKNSVKYKEDDFKHTNSPVLNRLRPPTPKLTNSPIVSRKVAATKVLNSPILERSKYLTKSSEAKNVGYFTCVENSPYMLRKSNSTTNYHERTSYFDKDISIKAPNMLQNSPEFQRHLNIQRSSSNASIRNIRSQNFVSRRSSFNSNDIDRISSRGKFAVASDSSSETGEQQRKSPLTPMSSGIKLNRAFSIRRARLNCESDTTPNTTPEERRRRAQSEVKTATPANKQQSYHRSRTNSVGAHNKESSKKAEPTKFRAPSMSRTDTGRFSMRAPKPTHHPPNSQKINQKPSKDHKKSGRSNSTLTSKEVEFQNWKRRKSYDPMKAAAEGRKKLMDNTKKHHSTEDGSSNHDNSVLRSASFHGTGGALSLANDWSDNELDYRYEDNQAPPPSSPQLEESDSDLETSSYLQTTQNVVSAMSARMTGYRPPLDSDNESDEDTSHSLRQNISKGLRHPSDTESSDERHAMTQSPISNTKYNKEFSLRNRIKLDPQRTKSVSSNVSRAKNLLHDTRSKSESFSSVRTESGRPGARISRVLSMVPKSKPKEPKKPPTPNVREVEMQNWKRRKSYDPMKAAMEGRRKAGLAKKNINTNLSP
ncbi:dentin sialophospho isoform x2, partial [Lasius niger]